MKFAGATVTIREVKATIGLLSYYRRFLASPHERCLNPENRYASQEYDAMTKDEARRRLGFLVNVAINRKAGILDVASRKQDSDYQASIWRDCRRVRDRVNSRVIVRQFETREVRERFGHLLTTADDD